MWDIAEVVPSMPICRSVPRHPCCPDDLGSPPNAREAYLYCGKEALEKPKKSTAPKIVRVSIT
jgi:hypothetical protein